MSGRQFILEAKWTAERVDLQPLVFLANRARQRLAGTLGLFVSMSGYTRGALDQIGRTGEQNALLLFDKDHVEAILAGLLPPHQLIDEAVEEAGATGRFYVPINELLDNLDRSTQPHLTPGPPPAYARELVREALPGISAEFVLHGRENIRGIAVDTEHALLIAVSSGLVRLSPEDPHMEWVLGLDQIVRNPFVAPNGLIYVLRGAAVIRLDKNTFKTIGGGIGPSSSLFEGPGGEVWALSRTGDPDARDETAEL